MHSLEPRAPSLAVMVTILLAETVILLHDSHLTPSPAWTPISPSVVQILRMCPGWEVGWYPLSDLLVPGPGPNHSFIHLPGLLGLVTQN